MKSERLYIIFLFLIFTDFLNAQVFDVLVAKDGSGTCSTVQSAINKVSDNNTSRTLIFIKKGIYIEKVDIPSSKINISLIGESAENVIITWEDYQGKDNITTASSYTFLTEGDDFYAENITFQNSAGSVGQAVAIRTIGDRQVFKNCRFLGFQDTYYAHKKRQYNFDCYIEGATDFIFGDATAVFDSCTINCVKGGQYITAPSDTKLTSTTSNGTFYHGLLFLNCNITAKSDVSDKSYYLGRPWQPNASSVYINCKMDKHIKDEGWSIWSGTNNHLSGFYGEYKSIDFNGNLIDTTQRADWSWQLNSSDVANYYSLNYFFKKDGIEWNPESMITKPIAPGNLINDDNILNWESSDDNIIGYVVFRNDSAIGYTDQNTYTDTTDKNEIEYTYYIKSVNQNGSLSEPSNNISYTNISLNKILSGLEIKITEEQIIFSDFVDFEIYSINGKLILSNKNINNYYIKNIKNGVYILKASNSKGSFITKKIIL